MVNSEESAVVGPNMTGDDLQAVELGDGFGVSDHREDASAGHGFEGLLAAGAEAGGVDDDIAALAAGCIHDGRGRIGLFRVDRVRRAQLLRGREPRVLHIHAEDTDGASHACHLEGQHSLGPGAEDRRRHARAADVILEKVDGRGQRLRHGRGEEVHSVGDRDEAPTGRDAELGEPAALRHAEKSSIFADGRPASTAGSAGAARHEGHDGDASPGLEVLNVRAHGRDFSGKLVAQNEGGHAPLAFSEEAMDVRSADTRFAYADDHFVGSRRGIVEFLDLYFSVGGVNQRFHCGAIVGAAHGQFQTLERSHAADILSPP